MPARDGTLTGHRREAADRRWHALGGELPGLATAFEPDAAAFALEDVLRPREDWRVTGCQLEHAMYRPGGAGCAVRFQLTLAGPDGRNMHRLVNGRLFSSRLAAARHLRRDLLPLVDRAGRRGEFELLSSVAAVVDQMAMAVSVYPVDGRLPALVDATDPAQMRWRLAEATGAPVTACAITRDRYGRGNRCILRYTLERSGGRETIVGKLTGGRGGEAAHRAVRELMRRPSTGRRRFHVPRSPGYLPDLQMLLLETVHGGPELSRRLKRFTHGTLDVMPALETGMAESAEVAAALHGTPLSGLPRRTARAESRRLERALEALSPALGDLDGRLRLTLELARRRLDSSPALELVTCHGDFKHNQLLFGDGLPTLVDLDTLCRAEPALDLGQFLAYLQLKLTGDDAPAPAGTAEHLWRCFIDAYLDAVGVRGGPGRDVEVRARCYAVLSLVERALHSWQKFKPERVDQVMRLLEQMDE